MKILSVDYQNDFASPAGRWFRPRPCVDFVYGELFPYLQQRGLKISEIVSDYRLPRPSETEAYCVPGTWGYESIIPAKLIEGTRWIKSMNSPSWTRPGAGEALVPPGQPYCAPSDFTEWLNNTIGTPDMCPSVVLIGLTLDCCVLSTAQELYYRGYKSYFLTEAVDTYQGSREEKDSLFRTPLSMWGSPIGWNELIKQFE